MSDQLSSDLASLRIDRDPKPNGQRGGRRYDGEPTGGALKKVVVVVLALALLAGVALFVVPAVRGALSTPVVEVTAIATVSPAQASTELTATGYVVPQTVSIVAAKVGGRVTEVKIRQGQEVKTGDVLMLLDPVDLDAQIAAARARVASARAGVATAQANLGEVEQQVRREKEGAASGISAGSVAADLEKRAESLRATVKAAAAGVRAAQAEVEALAVNRSSYTVTSPIDGRVVNKPPQPGEMVGPMIGGLASSSGGIEVADFATLAVEADVPEGRLGLVKVGGPAEIVLDAYPDRRYRGEVLELVPKVDRAKATVMVRVKFLDASDGVLPEMSARVGFLSGALDAEAVKQPPKLVVPKSALADRAGAKVVFVVEGDRLRMVPVEVGPAFGDGFELTRGPATGTKVVKQPAAELVDGMKVKESGT